MNACKLVRSLCRFTLAAAAAAAMTLPATAQVNPEMYSGMQWRLIGPFRAGRTVAVSGVPGQPSVFYMAPSNGGVWKTENYGETWDSLFKGEEDNSVGALAVAPSNSNVI